MGEAVIKGAQEKHLDLQVTDGFAAIPGHGVGGRAGGKEVLLGNVKLMQDRKIDITPLRRDWERLAGEDKTPHVRCRG